VSHQNKLTCVAHPHKIGLLERLMSTQEPSSNPSEANQRWQDFKDGDRFPIRDRELNNLLWRRVSSLELVESVVLGVRMVHLKH